MSKTITIPRENTLAIKVVRALQEDKQRLKEHLSTGGKLDEFQPKSVSELTTNK